MGKGVDKFKQKKHMYNGAWKETHDLNEELREGQNCCRLEREVRRVGEAARVLVFMALFKVLGFHHKIIA